MNRRKQLPIVSGGICTMHVICHMISSTLFVGIFRVDSANFFPFIKCDLTFQKLQLIQQSLQQYSLVDTPFSTDVVLTNQVSFILIFLS